MGLHAECPTLHAAGTLDIFNLGIFADVCLSFPPSAILSPAPRPSSPFCLPILPPLSLLEGPHLPKHPNTACRTRTIRPCCRNYCLCNCCVPVSAPPRVCTRCTSPLLIALHAASFGSVRACVRAFLQTHTGIHTYTRACWHCKKGRLHDIF